MGEYRFVMLFSVEADPDRLFDGLLRPEAWWPNAPHARDVQRLADGGPDGLGARYRVVIDAVTAPYAMDMEVEVTAVRPPERLEVRVGGDLRGRGTWELDTRGPVTEVRWLWEVATTKAWMNVLGAVARPVFVHNHDLVMREGIEALAASVGGRLVDHRRDGEARGTRATAHGMIGAVARPQRASPPHAHDRRPGTEADVERITSPVRLALVLLAVAIVLAIIGAVLKALRWLLYVAVVVLLMAGLVRWVIGSNR